MKMVFTTGEVAKHCNVACNTVGKWLKSGRIKYHRLPQTGSQQGPARIRRRDLIRFLVEHGLPLLPDQTAGETARAERTIADLKGGETSGDPEAA